MEGLMPWANMANPALKPPSSVFLGIYPESMGREGTGKKMEDSALYWGGVVKVIITPPIKVRRVIIKKIFLRRYRILSQYSKFNCSVLFIEMIYFGYPER
jgi:hypothetical protein